MTNNESRYQSFKDFWPFYLGEHANLLNRRLHFTGTLIVFGILLYAIATQNWVLCWAIPFAGYGFAWVGHFIVEKNRPATFKYPIWSLIGDFKMFFMILFGKLDAELARLKISQPTPAASYQKT